MTTDVPSTAKAKRYRVCLASVRALTDSGSDSGRKTLFTAYYGRSNEVLSLLSAAYADDSSIATRSRWNADKKAFEPSSTLGGPGGYQLDPRGTPPHTDEVTLSLRREVLENSVASIDYTYKRVGNIWDGVEENQIWDPTGTRVIGYANGMPQQVFRYTRPDRETGAPITDSTSSLSPGLVRSGISRSRTRCPSYTDPVGNSLRRCLDRRPSVSFTIHGCGSFTMAIWPKIVATTSSCALPIPGMDCCLGHS